MSVPGRNGGRDVGQGTQSETESARLSAPLVQLSPGLAVLRSGSTIVQVPDGLSMSAGETWLVVGPNGAGKSTLLSVLAGRLHPSVGSVTFFGEKVGACDLRAARRRVGYLSSALSAQLRPSLSALDVVRTGRRDALEPWWHRYDEHDDLAAEAALRRVDLPGFGARTLGTLSDGERRRVELARALVNDPDMLVLDEPTAGLDAPARVDTVELLESLTIARATVVHRLEDAPASTYAVVLGRGRVLATGKVADVVTSECLSEAYQREVQVERRGDDSLTIVVRRRGASIASY